MAITYKFCFYQFSLKNEVLVILVLEGFVLRENSGKLILIHIYISNKREC